MATTSMDITSFVGKLLEQDDVDALREGVRVLAQAVMETEVSGQIGAAPYERSTERTAYRNGYRTRRWDTRVGTIELKIPKVTAGAYFPSLLEPRRRAEKALHAVVVEAYVKGVSTRKVDDLVKALGIDGISRSEVSRICKVLDDEVRTFLARPIEPSCPYLWLDATFHKVREAGRVISVATVVAIGVTEQGERTVLGAATGASEDHQFWTSFLRQLVKRGLRGVRLVISDAHEGLRTAIAKVLHEAAWQRCRVHFMRNVLSVVPKQAQDAVAAIVRTIFAQPDRKALEEQYVQRLQVIVSTVSEARTHLACARRNSDQLGSERLCAGQGDQSEETSPSPRARSGGTRVRRARVCCRLPTRAGRACRRCGGCVSPRSSASRTGALRCPDP
jgi:putative transposase